MRCQREREAGSALLLTTILVVVLGLLMVALLNGVQSRGEVEAFADEGVTRFYAAEAGLSRAKLMVARHTDEASGENWLRKWAGTGSGAVFAANDPDAMRPAQWEDGSDYFDVGDGTSGAVRVRVFVLDTNPAAIDPYRTWYVVLARAELNDMATTLAMTMRPRDLFSRYARFVSDNELSIGSNAEYVGEVHCNKKIKLGGSNIKFHERTTCSDSFYGTYWDSSNTKGAPYTQFLKEFQSGVGTIALPEEAAIEALGTNPPADAKMYDSRNADFKSTCASKTGYTPTTNDRVDVSFTFKKDIMDTQVKVYNSSGTLKASYTTTDEEVPHNNMLYVRGNSTCKGDISSRATLFATKTATVDGPLRYVNESGDSQYGLYKNGSLSSFDSGKKEWTDTGDWKSSGYEYQQIPGWTQPTDDGGNPYNPCLGIVAAKNIYLGMGGATNNLEVHAFLFSSESVVSPKSGTDTSNKNLYVLGGLITTGTNPLSGNWAYRQYVYDKNVMNAPPPYFPSTPVPVFRNWHEVGSEVANLGAGTYKLTLSKVKNLFF